jgi:hypothetical protein
MYARFKSFMAVVKEFYEDNEFLCVCVGFIPVTIVMAAVLNYFFPK